MYEDVSHRSIDWKPLLTKGAVIIGILISLLLIVSIFYSNSNNTEIIQESYAYQSELDSFISVSKSYFRENDIPTTMGESLIITLDTLVSNNYIEDFSNSGVSCDLENSFSKITKVNKDEYTLMVQLSCGGSIEFIVTTIDI